MTTVIVSHIDGTTFEAPAKGPVLKSDYVPTEAQMDAIIEENRARQDAMNEILVDGVPVEELLERDIKVKKVEAANRRYYDSLPKYFQYDRKGNIRATKTTTRQ